MEELSPEMLEAVGLDPHGSRDFLGTAEVEERAAGFGLSVADAVKALGLAAMLSGPMDQHPDYDPVELPGAGNQLVQAVQPQRWQRDPALLMLEARQPVAFRWAGSGAAQVLTEGGLAVDVRSGPVLVRASTPQGDLLLRCRRDGIDAWGVEAQPSPELDALRSWQPAATPHFEVPAVTTVLPDPDAPRWLRDAVEQRLQSGAALDVAVAFGLAARLAPAPRNVSLDALLAAPAPEAQGLAWLGRAGAPLRDALARRVSDEADLLVADLARVESAVAANAPDARPLAREWLHRRDDLESAVFLLERSGEAKSERAALEAVDREAAHRQAVFALLESFDDDERLREVSWQEPDAWWGGLAVG